MNTKTNQANTAVLPIAVAPKVARAMLACGPTRLYEFLNDGKSISDRDGKFILPIAVPPKVAKAMLACGTTRLYELLNNGEFVSYRDGKSRKILTASVLKHVESRIAAEATMPKSGWTSKATQARAENKKLTDFTQAPGHKATRRLLGKAKPKPARTK